MNVTNRMTALIVALSALVCAHSGALAGGYVSRGTPQESMNCSCGAQAWVLVGDGSPVSEVVVQTTRSKRGEGSSTSRSEFSIGGSDRRLLGCETLPESTGGFGQGVCSISQSFRVVSR